MRGSFVTLLGFLGRELSMSASQQSGTLPSTLTRLSALSTLSLSGNAFTGSIPTTWSTMTQLVYLNLSAPVSATTGLSGSLPRLMNSLRYKVKFGAVNVRCHTDSY